MRKIASDRKSGDARREPFNPLLAFPTPSSPNLLPISSPRLKCAGTILYFVVVEIYVSASRYLNAVLPSHPRVPMDAASMVNGFSQCSFTLVHFSSYMDATKPASPRHSQEC